MVEGDARVPFVRFVRRPYEEPYHLELVITASNGRQRGELVIYCTPPMLEQLAAELAQFPRHRDDVVLWELGSPRREERWAYHFRMRALQLSADGQCVVELRFDNLREFPEQEQSEFCLHAKPADFVRLAELLSVVSPELEDVALEWTLERPRV